jgi:hypothetical protein
VPLERIDSTSFMPGKTSTIYRRGIEEWKGSLILMLARGGWIDTTYGNLELLNDQDATWFARVQSLYLHFQSEGRIKAFGGIPGDVQTYGFGALDGEGSVYVVVNPAQDVAKVSMPLLSEAQRPLGQGHLLFRDAGFEPKLSGDTIELGPGQMAMVGFGKYAAPAFDLGIQKDVVIPRAIQPVSANFQSTGKGVIQASTHRKAATCASSCSSTRPMAACAAPGQQARQTSRTWASCFCSRPSRTAKSSPFAKTTIARYGPDSHGQSAKSARKM